MGGETATAAMAAALREAWTTVEAMKVAELMGMVTVS